MTEAMNDQHVVTGTVTESVTTPIEQPTVVVDSGDDNTPAQVKSILPDMVDANSFAELMEYYGDDLIQIDQDVAIDKSDLVNVPFIITTWMEGKDNKYGSEQGFVVVRAITADDRKVFFTDGGTGIAQQLRALYARTERRGGYAIRKGLRVSEYEAENGQGEKIMAKTFYLS